MNRLTPKEYLVDITLHNLHFKQPTQPTKIKCELHFQDDSYLKYKSQPLKDGLAQFNAERLLFPFVTEVALVFKLVRNNKKQNFLGHYTLNLETMLNNKQYRCRNKPKLEQAEVWIDFQCNIIDKQLLCDSDTEQPEPDNNPQAVTKSTIASVQLSPKHHYNKPLSQLNSPFIIMKKSGNHIPLPPEQFGYLLQEAQDILNKRQFFNQRHNILKHYIRDKQGRLRTNNIESLESRLIETQHSNFTFNAGLYLIIGMIAFVLGLKL